MIKPRFFRSVSLILLLAAVACRSGQQPATTVVGSLSEDERLILRADSFELNTPYEEVPGDSLSHHASGFAKILCSAVFITGLDFDFAAENIGYFTAPYHVRSKFDRQLDREEKAIHVVLPNGLTRTAKYVGDQGCICLPEGEDRPFFDPVNVSSSLPDPATQAWPMGDQVALPDELGIDLEKVRQAEDAVFEDPNLLTAAFVVTHQGQLIGERYREGLDMNTRLESWSMGKSLTATLMGVLIQQEEYGLYQPAPVPEWYEAENDPRQEIRISDILRMSSGLRFRAPQDPDFDPAIGYPDHIYVYTGSVNSFQWAATRPQQWLPNTVGRYRNSDPVLVNYLIRLAVEARGQNYWTFPQRDLFDKIGIRNMVMETDPFGNFLIQGYEFGTARDWARLGNLYLQDGVWNSERILPEGFVEFVSSVAPAWKADGRNIYGGFFWINGEGDLPIPTDAYFMAGAGGQYTYIIPSHQLVIVILTHYKGGSLGSQAREQALELVMQALEN